MGSGYSYTCRECGRGGSVSLGVGMLYPDYCEKVKREALEGKMGEEWMQYVKEHPAGRFDCERTIYICECGGWHEGEKCDYYTASDDTYKFNEYFTGDKAFRGEIRYSGRSCPKCRKKMRPTDSSKLENLGCPECGGELIFKMIYSWD